MYDKIVFPVDLNEQASWAKALPTALALCRTFGASLHVVTALPDYRMPLVGSYFPEDFIGKARQALDEAQREFVEQNVPDDVEVHRAVLDGSPWSAIVKAASELQADLIVMASHNKRRFSDYVLGPNAEHVVHHSRISVMVVR